MERNNRVLSTLKAIVGATPAPVQRTVATITASLGKMTQELRDYATQCQAQIDTNEAHIRALRQENEAQAEEQNRAKAIAGNLDKLLVA